MENNKKEIKDEELDKVVGGKIGEYGYGDDTKCSFNYSVNEELYYNPNVIEAYKCRILERYSYKVSKNYDSYSPLYKIILLYNNEILSDVINGDLVKALSTGVTTIY